MLITLQRNATCAQCGAAVPAGQKAKWYRNGTVYGIGCHESDRRRRGERIGDVMERGGREDEPLGLTYSRYDKYGFYSHDGRRLGSSCGCEDYPCCGH
jgi:hypothetical protein